MRITRDMLLKLAKDTVDKRFKPDGNVVAVFLTGSVREETGDPLIGGTTDIDLLVITKHDPLREREIIKISNEIHMDIMYESEKVYAKPRELRADPWRGWLMWDPMLLHEKGRFFEYTQSSLRSQFDDPVNVLARASYFATRARETWTHFQFGGEPDAVKYLSAVQDAGNSLVCLKRAPYPERRFIPGFSEQAKSAGMPEMENTLSAMIGGLDVTADEIRAWLPAWEAAFQTASAAPEDLRIHPSRLAYYKASIETALENAETLNATWILVNTWALAAQASNLSIEQAETWSSASKYLGLHGPSFETRLQSLDHYLDIMEEKLDEMARSYGL